MLRERIARLRVYAAMAEADPYCPARQDAAAATAIHPTAWDRAQWAYDQSLGRWERQPWWIRWPTYLLVLLFAVWAVLYVTKGRFLKGPFESIVSKSLQRETKVGGDFNLFFDPLSLHFKAEQLRVAGPKWAKDKDTFQSDLIDTRVSPLSLVFGDKANIKTLLMQNGRLDLRWSPDGKTNSWTFGDPKAPPKPLELPAVRRALVNGTAIDYRDPRLQLVANIKVDTVRAADTRFASHIRFHGNGTMRAKPFTLNGGLLTPNDLVAGGKNQMFLNAASGPTHLEVSGTLPGATIIEGADLRTVVHGANLSLLFDFLGVAIPDTRSYRITAQTTKAGDEWRFTRLTGRFGDSDIAGKMTAAMRDRLYLSADLSTRSLDMIDVGPFIGYSPEKLDATGASAVVTQVNGAPRILPNAPLRVEALRNFDADVKYSVRQVKNQNVPISNIGLTLKLERNLLTLSPLTFDMAGGHVASDISINARQQPVFTKYDIRLSPTPMGTLLGRWGVDQSGTSGVIKARVEMTGSGDTVAKSLATSNGRIAVILPAGTMWARNIQLSELDIGVFVQRLFEKKLKKPVNINCGLIAFTVRDGVAAADPILIDTSKNVMLGTGSFSFRDESLDLKFRADGKKISLFSAQSPIRIGGHFAEPGIGIISPELIARGAVGLGLGVVATPFAAILAFVDPGNAQSAACGPVLSGANAAAQRTSKGKARTDIGDGRPTKESQASRRDR